MLLQFDIQPFLKVSQVIAAVQEKIGIREPFTTGDAIKSVKTYAKYLDQYLQKDCNKVYRLAEFYFCFHVVLNFDTRDANNDGQTVNLSR